MRSLNYLNFQDAHKNNKRAFSVAEAMMALLIGSVALGMAAPVITKQVKSTNMREVQIEVLQQTIIPRGAIMFFDLDDCPEGWTALNSAGAFIRDIGGEAAARGVIQEGGVPNLVGFNGMSTYGQVDGKLFTISSTIGSKSKKGDNWEVGADFNASGYSTVYKDGLNEVRPKNIAYLACKKN